MRKIIKRITENFPSSLRRRLHEEIELKEIYAKKLAKEVEEKEMHAFSVRSLIKQRERLFEILEYVGNISKFENGNSLEAILKQIRTTESQFYQDIICTSSDLI